MAYSQDKYKQKILELLKDNPIVSMATKRLHVGRETYYRWYHEDKDFAKAAREAIEVGDEYYNDIAESSLMHLVKKGDMRAISYRLDHRSKRYNNPKSKFDDEKIYYKPVTIIPFPPKKDGKDVARGDREKDSSEEADK